MNLLEVDDVHVAFGGLRVLTGVSLAVPDGGIVGLIGPNGAGKSTLFNAISGLRRPDWGTVHFDGRDVSALPAPARAALGIGRNFQNLGLMPTETVLTNLLAAQHLSAGYLSVDVAIRPRRWWRAERRLRARATEAAAAFDVAEHLDRRVEDLSFAAARFVELAGVLALEPRLMLLDEPTTGLDPAETTRLGAVLRRERAAGTSILLVAHDVRFVMELCDRVAVLAQGRILVDGPPAEVQRHPAVVEAYLGRSA
ncbi:MAG: ATP-binding cassette domain-containing protein [Actinomycetota bacterium]